MKRSFTTIMFLAAALYAQTTQTTGAIQGSIADDSGTALSSVQAVAVNPALGGKSYSSATNSTGNFSLSGVAPGTYSICVQAPGSPHLDPCNWAKPVQVRVTAGETVAAGSVVAVKGTLLQVRVNDPGGLWQVGSGNPDILLGVQLPAALFQPMRLASSDSAGKSFDVAIPAGTPVQITMYAPHFTIVDSNGIAPSATVAAQAPTGQATLQLTYTITGTK
jgi:hypothetical protein